MLLEKIDLLTEAEIQLSESNGKNKALKDALEGKAKDLQSLETRLEEVSGRLEKVRVTHKSLDVEVSEWKGKAENLQKEADELRDDRNVTLDKLGDARDKLGDEKARVERRDAQIKKLRSELNEKDAVISAQRQEVKQWTRDYSKINDQNKLLAGRNQELMSLMSLLMVECPSGAWNPIVAEVASNQVVVTAQETQGWNLLPSWSDDPVLAVEATGGTMTALALHLVAIVKAESRAGLLSCLSGIQLALDGQPNCVESVVDLLLCSLLQALQLPDPHPFLDVVILQVAQRLGEAWPQARDRADEVLQYATTECSVFSLVESMWEWEGKDLQGNLAFHSAIQYDNLVLVGFDREPDGIIGIHCQERQIRWIDGASVQTEGSHVRVGSGEQGLRIGIGGDDCSWWLDHAI